MPQIHTAKATRRAVIIAIVIGLLAIPLIIGLLYWVNTAVFNPSTNCVPATSWSAWSDCSVPCSPNPGQGVGGWQYRTRPPAALPTNGGTECDITDLIQSQTCNTDVPCGLPCVPNPDPDQFAWSGCPSCIPQGASEVFQWRIVPPLQQPGPYGAPCPADSIFQTSLCTDVPSCSANFDCVISTTTVVASTSCNAVCGPGVQILWHSISQTQSGQGTGCDWNLLVEQVPCTGPPCPTTASCDASQETWSDWSQCDVACGTGWQYATREPSGPLDHCPLVQSQSCNGLLLTCSDGNTSNCCIVGTTCTTPTWDYLEALCYMQCAGMPFPAQPPIDNGLPFCSVTQDMLDAACGAGAVPGQGACLEPVDCQLTPWSAWSDCSVGGCDSDYPLGGTQVSWRSITSYAVGGGVPCSAFPTVLYQPCNNMQAVQYMSLSSLSDQVLLPATEPAQCVPVNCQLSPWYPVSGCSVACGSGWQMLAASITVPPSGGGSCDLNVSDFVSSQTCDSGVTCGDCQFMSLTQYLEYMAGQGQNPWSTCSAQCDGTMTLTLPLIASASAGGSCDYSGAIATAPCCVGCSCEDACPVGVNGEPCTNNGTCVSVTNANVLGGWSYSCNCSGDFMGLACGVQCPINPDGSVCGSAAALGTCNTALGVCDCNAGLSGAACELGGWCYVTAGDFNGGTWLELAVPLNDTSAGAITQGTCQYMGAALVDIPNIWIATAAQLGSVDVTLAESEPALNSGAAVASAALITSLNASLQTLNTQVLHMPVAPTVTANQAATTMAWSGFS